MYKIELTREAESTYSWLFKHDRKLFDRIRVALEDLKLNPWSGKSLTGELHGRRSYRIGTYRLLYTVYKEKLLVHILDIGHRREIYRGR